MNSTIIISGGNIDIEFTREYLRGRKYDNVIAVDGGLEATEKLGIVPTFIVGDFDTVSPAILEKYTTDKRIQIKRFNPDKDYTDTCLAMMTAIEINSFSVEIFGGIGTRFDHSLANIQLLQQALINGIDAAIIDKNNIIRLIGEKRKMFEFTKSEGYKYVSLIPITDEVKLITTKGLKYNLTSFTMDIKKNVSLGVSNEIVDKKAEIIVHDGILAIIESRD